MRGVDRTDAKTQTLLAEAQKQLGETIVAGENVIKNCV